VTIDPEHPGSTVREVWLLAASKKGARRLARYATAVATEMRQGSVNRGSPWLWPDLSTCEQKACPFPLEHGAVLGPDGSRIN
jgi:hypothetical protein